jgi:hypothetical protein
MTIFVEAVEANILSTGTVHTQRRNSTFHEQWFCMRAVLSINDLSFGHFLFKNSGVRR